MLAGPGRRRGMLLSGAAWLMLGTALAAMMVAGWSISWSAALLFAVPLTGVYGSAVGFSTYYLCRAYPLATRSPAMIMLVFSVASMCMAALWSGVGAAWRGLWDGMAPGVMDLGVDVHGLATAMFGAGVLLYLLAAVLHYLVIEHAAARQAERRELQLALQAREAELRMLRTQIDPHFLFNSLHSISALTAVDPAGARDMTLRLAAFFRQSLGLEAQRKVPLAQELALVDHFIAIEQVRFGSRLRYTRHGIDAAASCLVPPMILQPLVENAVKHGIGGLPDGGAIRVTAASDGVVLRLVVENDVDDDVDRDAGRGQGVGLVNVRARLATGYGHLASVHWRRFGNTFRVELTLPAETGVTACA